MITYQREVSCLVCYPKKWEGRLVMRAGCDLSCFVHSVAGWQESNSPLDNKTDGSMCERLFTLHTYWIKHDPHLLLFESLGCWLQQNSLPRDAFNLSNSGVTFKRGWLYLIFEKCFPSVHGILLVRVNLHCKMKSMFLHSFVAGPQSAMVLALAIPPCGRLNVLVKL